MPRPRNQDHRRLPSVRRASAIESKLPRLLTYFGERHDISRRDNGALCGVADHDGLDDAERRC